jgi:hypothetical protein
MNITLRKANAIQHSIQEAIKSIPVNLVVEINEFQDAAVALKQANDQLFQADARRQRLLLALYNIRGLVGNANVVSGIDLKLTTAAFLDRRITQLEDLAKSRSMTDLAVINGKLEKIRNRKEESRASIYGRNDDVVETTVVSQDQIDQAKAEVAKLKKEKQKLNDEILELNIKTEIPLGEEVVKTLQSEGII